MNKQKLILVSVAFVFMAVSFYTGYRFGAWEADVAFPQPMELWVKETGLRIDIGTSPDVIRFPDGTWRMYYTVEEGIVSAISTNSMDWTKEGGFRLTADPKSKDQARIGSPDVFQIGKDKFRMIFEGMDEKQKEHKLFSAVSSDGITWTRESGVRLEDVSSAGHKLAAVPDVLTLPDGRLRMYYTDGYDIKTAVSKDQGYKWKKENMTGIKPPATDPSVMILSDGVFKMYYTISDSAAKPKNMRIVSANSEDGIHWNMDSGIRMRADQKTVLVMDPNVVQISLGKARMFYAQVESGSLTDPKDPPVVTIHSAGLELR